jgi:glycosyltransferase involved in cell wall biosynthesis
MNWGNMPRVSVVLIFLNEERFLEEAVHSVCAQTLADWELILVDDGSTDRSTDIARNFAAQDERIRYVDHPRHENRGMAASRNFGVSHSSSRYLAFIDGDDVWVPSKLAEQTTLLDSMPEVAMINGAILYWSSWPPGSSEQDYPKLTGGFADQRLDPPRAALEIYPLGPADGAGVDLLVRRNVFDEVGGFEERFRGMYEDQSFLIKVYLRYPIYISSSIWLLYRQHGDSECATTSLGSYLGVRGVFLDWLEDDVEQLEDPAVHEALRRARRRLRCQRLSLPVRFAYQSIRDRLPPHIKRRVKRIFRNPKRPR